MTARERGQATASGICTQTAVVASLLLLYPHPEDTDAGVHMHLCMCVRACTCVHTSVSVVRPAKDVQKKFFSLVRYVSPNRKTKVPGLLKECSAQHLSALSALPYSS